MTDKTQNKFAAYGLKILKRAVLLVLYDETEALEGGKLQLDEIRERLGIPRIAYPPVTAGNVNALVYGILQHLQMGRLVDHLGRLVDHSVKVGWRITTKGVEFIDGTENHEAEV